MVKAYIGLGSNIGDKIGYLNQAINLLREDEHIKIKKVSSFYETAPVDYVKQDRFVNAVVSIETHLSPYELLEVCQSIEKKLNRKREIRYGPRTIDLDILLYDEIFLKDTKLTIPHPRMKARAFVLIPLYEIEPHLLILNEPLKLLVEKIKKDLKKDDLVKINM